jgi:hypothetical protein
MIYVKQLDENCHVAVKAHKMTPGQTFWATITHSNQEGDVST